MDNSKKLIADFPVNAAEFFTAITHAATELYISMHVLDLEDKTVFPIKSNKFIDKFMKCDIPLQESLTNIMVNLACPESIATIKNFTTLSTLPERMKNTNVISEIFSWKDSRLEQGDICSHRQRKTPTPSPVPCRKRECANDKAGTRERTLGTEPQATKYD